MTQPAQSHLFNCVLWHGIDNGNVRQFTPRHFTPDITRVTWVLTDMFNLQPDINV